MQAILQPKFIIWVYNNPKAVFTYMSHMEWLEPVLNTFQALNNYMIFTMHSMDTIMKALMARSMNSTNSTNSTNFQPPRAFMSALERHKRFTIEVMPFVQGFSRMLPSQYNSNLSFIPYTDFDEPVIKEIIERQRGRRLLNEPSEKQMDRQLLNILSTDNSTTIMDWKQQLGIIEPLSDSLGSIQAYSALVAGAGKRNPDLATYKDWLDGGQWPPLDRTALGTCPSGAAMAKILVGAFDALKEQMTNPKPVNNFSWQKVNDTFPSFHRYNGSIGSINGSIGNTGRILYTPPSIITIVMGGFKSFIVDVLGIDIRYVIGFFTGGFDTGNDDLTLAKSFMSVFKCDFQSVMDCQKKRANFFTGFLGVCLILAIIYMALGSMAAFVLGGVGVVPLMLWYVYGYSPACIPMIPLCAVTDLLDTVTWLIPVEFIWPKMLQKTPGCAMDKSIPYTDCFIPCSDPPFRYNGWEASVAWAACDWNSDWCISKVMPWARINNFVMLWSELVDKYNAIENDRTGVTPPDYGRIDAERFCFVITIFNVVPYIFIGLALVYAASAVLALPFVVLQWAAETFFQALAYIHTSQRGHKE